MEIKLYKDGRYHNFICSSLDDDYLFYDPVDCESLGKEIKFCLKNIEDSSHKKICYQVLKYWDELLAGYERYLDTISCIHPYTLSMYSGRESPSYSGSMAGSPDMLV